MPHLAPTPDLIARFRRDLARIAGDPARLGLAVSGGPDSVALLLLASAALDGGVYAATVDHGLRPGSAAEALKVEQLCSRLEVPHATLCVVVPNGRAGLQGDARRARYAALSEWASRRNLDAVATGHHADDQAETLLMRLRRGSGVGGLSGIRPVRRDEGLTVVRPLLGWSKTELVHIVSSAAIDAADDPSNQDDRFDRTAVRRLLASDQGFDPHRLARTATALAEADEALDWAAEALAEDRCTSAGGEWRIDASGLPRELRRRLLSHAIGEVRAEHGLGPPWTGNEDVETLLAALEAGEAGTLAGVAARGGPVWHLRVAPPRRPVRG